MEARNRNLKDWYGKLQRGEIKLPRFQRHEAWDRPRVASLLETVVQSLPLGITLTLEVGEEEQFISRYLTTAAPQTQHRVLEQLLDGQQRLTALWRAFHNNYERETYYIYIKAFDKDDYSSLADLSAFCRTRYFKNGERYPLWCDSPVECLKRGLIPTNLLKPEDIQGQIDEWIDAATSYLEPDGSVMDEIKAFFDYKRKVSDKIKDLRSIVANYNLPFLALPAKTDKSVALDVFIKMNTNSKPLTQYDVIVAEVESVMGRSLHDLQEDLDRKYPAVRRYGDLSDLILTASALLQNYIPNQRGAWDMDKQQMVANWNVMEIGLNRMTKFLAGEGIYDRQRLPTNAVLAVIAALYKFIPEHGDKRSQDEMLLKKYLWYSFFSDRYENSAAGRAFADFVALRRIICGERKKDGQHFGQEDVPIFADHNIVEKDELIKAEWPKRATILGRAILAITCRLGAKDFATGEKLTLNNIEHRHYHHIYPDALLKEAEQNSYLALNCALIADRTNISIGRKEPLQYLKERYQWTAEEIVKERLNSHLIPISELANGGYEGLSEAEKKDKIERDFDKFIKKRAEIVWKAVNLLIKGRDITPSIVLD
jgi:hypothetical protein